MSEKLGPLTFGKQQELIFLGKELGEERDYSEKTADLIDAEVRRFVEIAYEKAKQAIHANKDLVLEIVDVLKVRETLQGDELKSFLTRIKKEPELNLQSI